MNRSTSFIFCLGLFIGFTASATQRISKKDKQDLVEMFTEFIDGMERSDMPIKDQIESRWWFWQSPMTRIEKSIDNINGIMQQIQNFIVAITPPDNHEKECCNKVLRHLEMLEVVLQQMMYELGQQRLVLGNLEDESVGEQDFNCVQDIDNAQLSALSWLKTIYREQLKDKFNS